MRCPRRDDMSATFGLAPGTEDTGDEWKDDACTYCGSMSPDKFMEQARARVELGPTDKNYKVYVGPDDRHKFYFQHLPSEQQVEFFELLAGGKLNVGHPGHFYVRPFFIVRMATPAR